MAPDEPLRVLWSISEQLRLIAKGKKASFRLLALRWLGSATPGYLIVKRLITAQGHLAWLERTHLAMCRDAVP